MDQIIIYQSEDGRTKLDVRLEEQTVWLNQKQLTKLFGKAKGTISEHIKNIFEDKELQEDSVVRLFRTTASDGKQYEVAYYNLDMVLALGFRVRSPVAVRFRQWAADKLKEYIVKGFVLDDERLKNPQVGNDYFEELTRRIQDIRTSERRFYQKITDIYATSIDYDKDHFAATQAEWRIAMTMSDWITKLEGFLALNDREILQDAGKVSAELARAHVEREFATFRKIEDNSLESDFDRAVKQLPSPKKP